MSYDRNRLKVELIGDECIGGIVPLDAYLDSNGLWTVGVGHLLHPGKVTEPRVRRITLREAMAWLDIDIEDAEVALDRVLPGWSNLSNMRQRALVNMAFNRGEKHMRESTTITPAIKAAMAGSILASWQPVKDAIVASPWAAQIKGRAVRIADMLVNGVA